ncbi:hypothetical protein BDV40DRAFT_248517 [Aspergillus tamarii]|uniref:Uncharacterized protein n=1 Tax=Aspergillus tamarii TaxID=41984 RepID=A0A5N6UKK0_ASPTM|nr:hypothetical protein BDV40DRAFT_248517 [Aspergillus tamarii]
MTVCLCMPSFVIKPGGSFVYPFLGVLDLHLFHKRRSFCFLYRRIPCLCLACLLAEGLSLFYVFTLMQPRVMTLSFFSFIAFFLLRVSVRIY